MTANGRARTRLLLLPQLSLRALAVWRRNFLVWKKLAIPRCWATWPTR
jgi:hypothetical protein